MVQSDLTKSFDITQSSSYTSIDQGVLYESLPHSDAALWTNNKQDRLFSFGGRTRSSARGQPNAKYDYFDISKNDWFEQSSESVYFPGRLAYGAYTDAPEIQAGFWIGGLRNNITTEAIIDDANIYPRGLLIFNTTTMEMRNMTDLPFGPTQHGALEYLPSDLNMGTLVYLGGERPKNTDVVKKASDYKYDIATLDKIWVYDIENKIWYEQEVTGEVPKPRTEFCSVKATDPRQNGAHHLYIIGGADFQTKEMQNDV